MLFVAVMLPQSVSAKTWYIKADGTGDAAFIWSGIDSAAAGDTVLVGPGTYEVAGIQMKDGVILRSEAGPYRTKLIRPPTQLPPTAITCQLFVASRTEISGFWFDGFVGIPPGLGTIWINGCLRLYITNNILTNNEFGIVGTNQNQPVFVFIENNTFVGHVQEGLGGVIDGWLTNNIIWDRATNVGFFLFAGCNDFLDLTDAQQFAGANFSVNPQFCGAGAGNYFLQDDSPSVPGQSPLGPQCGLVGALPVGCGTTPVEEKTWGAIKSLYHG